MTMNSCERINAHRRLGFSHDAMRRWMQEAGFTVALARDLGHEGRDQALAGESLTVSIWLAEKAGGSVADIETD